MKFRTFRGINNISQFVLRSKYVYAISESGILTKVNPSNGKIRYQYQVDSHCEQMIFTSLLVVPSAIIISGIVKNNDETSICDLIFLSKRKKRFKTIQLESKSFRLAKEAEGSLYELNPVDRKSTV